MHFDAKTSEYFLELLCSALHNRPAQTKPQDVSWNDLFEYAKSQSLSTMALFAIQRSGFDIGCELAKEWGIFNARNLVKYYNQEHECELLCKAFSEAGIMNMPLKGSMIRVLYPAPEMREMCDLDILVKPEDIDRAHAVMLENGYTYVEENTTSHNRGYHKLPYLSVEVHNYLLPQENKLFFYYSDFWAKTAYEMNGFSCLMSWDDCYVYMIAHAYKHFYRYGTGIRSALDIYVLRDRLKDVLHRAYIVEELNKLGILEFTVAFEQLADCWFSENKMEIPQDLQIIHYRILECGTYGDYDSMKLEALLLIQRGKSIQSAKRAMKRSMLFPSLENMKVSYPALNKVPFLLPLFWLFRWIRILVLKPKKIQVYFNKLKHFTLPGSKDERR